EEACSSFWGRNAGYVSRDSEFGTWRITPTWQLSIDPAEAVRPAHCHHDFPRRLFRRVAARSNRSPPQIFSKGVLTLFVGALISWPCERTRNNVPVEFPVIFKKIPC